jgi:triosephosphate isomerase
MPPARRPLIAGNWKMNGLKRAMRELDAVIEGVEGRLELDIVLCPPATLVCAFSDRATGSRVHIGGQDCHPDATGAHTGDVSAEMLADAGATYVIVGHSERRADHGETDALVKAKAEAGLRAGLTPIVCVGETLGEREAGRADEVVAGQIAGSLPAGGEIVVAYEPVWAIGTGRSATTADIAAMHGLIRARLGGRAAETRILYGGSVKPDNAQAILSAADVDGALVGGASLKSADFLAIIAAAPHSSD